MKRTVAKKITPEIESRRLIEREGESQSEEDERGEGRKRKEETDRLRGAGWSEQ